MLGSLGLTCNHFDSHGITWIHLDAIGITWTHLDSLGITWTHLESLGFTWNHLESLGITWIHLDSLGITWTKGNGDWQGKRESLPRPKGKRENPRMRFEAHSHLTITARTHARTKRNDFPVRGACLKADSLPPTSDIYIYIYIYIYMSRSICQTLEKQQ